MPRIALYQVDAFTDRLFAGNPAAVCPMESWPDEPLMQAIAAENNLAETAFLVPEAGDSNRWSLRWFTPECEVDLCGHATLASAWVVLNRIVPGAGEVTFDTRSGPLHVTRDGERLTMRFPRRPAAPCGAPEALVRGLGAAPLETRRARDFLAVFAKASEIEALRPDFTALSSLDALGVIATAPGGLLEAGPASADFVSRFFAPRAGVPEDHVTGSAHCTLVPYWSERLGKKRLTAYQASRRGGVLLCEDTGDAVLLSGRAVLYLEGAIGV